MIPASISDESRLHLDIVPLQALCTARRREQHLALVLRQPPAQHVLPKQVNQLRQLASTIAARPAAAAAAASSAAAASASAAAAASAAAEDEVEEADDGVGGKGGFEGCRPYAALSLSRLPMS